MVDLMEALGALWSSCIAYALKQNFVLLEHMIGTCAARKLVLVGAQTNFCDPRFPLGSSRINALFALLRFPLR
jgi:hypothetical protein